MKFLNFDLAIDPQHDGIYPITVVDSPAGQGKAEMRWPLDGQTLLTYLSPETMRDVASGGSQQAPEQMESIGRKLFDALMTGEVRELYAISRDRAKNKGMGLRLKLRIRAPELAGVPWELICRDGPGDYVCLSSSTPVVRYLEVPHPTDPLWITPPLRILGMVASPPTLLDLDVRREQAHMTDALKPLIEGKQAELHWVEGQTSSALQSAMRNGPWHIFHFIGHGGYDQDQGFLALRDHESPTKAQWLSAEDLTMLLCSDLSRSPRLVFLNACDQARTSGQAILSSTASILVRRGIPAVVAMQRAISDRAAIALAQTFYAALVAGFPVDAALGDARIALKMGSSTGCEWSTPVLFMHSPDGTLLYIMPTHKTEPPPDTDPPLMLPPPLDKHFRGRERELTQLVAKLQPGKVVALTGPGGIGKTTLAAQALSRLKQEGALTRYFPDGVLFHDFQVEPRASVALEAFVLGFREELVPTPIEAARRVLSRKHALLVLDGTERADDLRLILDRRGQCGVLITSQRLGEAPDDEDTPISPLPLDQAMDALRSWAGTSHVADNAAQRICESVGGLPLALQLIGRFLHRSRMPPEDLAEHLSTRPFAIVGDVTSHLGRSVTQLAATTQQALGVIGILALAPIQSAEVAYALDVDELTANQALDELASYSILIPDSTEQGYKVSHSLVRDYAGMHHPVSDSTLGRMVDYFRGFADEFGRQGSKGFTKLDPKRPHFLALMQQCSRRAYWHAILPLAESVYTYLDLQGHWSQIDSVSKLCMDAAQHTGSPSQEATWLGRYGIACLNLGDAPTCIRSLERCLDISRSIHDLAAEGRFS